MSIPKGSIGAYSSSPFLFGDSPAQASATKSETSTIHGSETPDRSEDPQSTTKKIGSFMARLQFVNVKRGDARPPMAEELVSTGEDDSIAETRSPSDRSERRSSNEVPFQPVSSAISRILNRRANQTLDDTTPICKNRFLTHSSPSTPLSNPPRPSLEIAEDVDSNEMDVSELYDALNFIYAELSSLMDIPDAELLQYPAEDRPVLREKINLLVSIESIREVITEDEFVTFQTLQAQISERFLLPAFHGFFPEEN